MHLNTSFAPTNTCEEITEENIQSWLADQIARINGLAANDIDINQPFASYGLDSVAAAALSGELANWLGSRLAPTIMWDYPSVRLLARYLVSNPGGELALAI
jgi:acyl carrier protein